MESYYQSKKRRKKCIYLISGHHKKDLIICVSIDWCSIIFSITLSTINLYEWIWKCWTLYLYDNGCNDMNFICFSSLLSLQTRSRFGWFYETRQKTESLVLYKVMKYHSFRIIGIGSVYSHHGKKWRMLSTVGNFLMCGVQLLQPQSVTIFTPNLNLMHSIGC